MHVLVTGASGRVGSRLVPRLVNGGATVRVLVRTAAGAASARAAGADVVLGDIRNVENVADAIRGVDAVVHAAASFRGVSPQEMADVNVSGTALLAEAMGKTSTCRLVFLSTNLVYGAGNRRPALESDPTAPTGAYPTSKAQAELFLRERHERDGLDVCVLRLAFVYGDGDPHLREAVPFTAKWAAHKRLHMVHHADVAQAIRLTLRRSDLAGRIFNVADDAPLTAYELRSLNRSDPDSGSADGSASGQWDGIVDTTAIREELGFRPIYPTVYTARDAGAL